MNKNFKLILGILVLVIVIAGAYIAYNNLSKAYDGTALQTQSASQTQSNSSTDEKVTAPDFTVTD